MSSFTGPLSIQFQDEPERSAKLLEDLIWEVDELGSGKFIVVPKGFLSDGGTIPWVIWWLLPPWGDRATRAYILHDYARSRISWGNPHPYAPTFEECDKQLAIALKALKVDPIRQWIINTAVWVNTKFVGDKGEAYGPPVE